VRKAKEAYSTRERAKLLLSNLKKLRAEVSAIEARHDVLKANYTQICDDAILKIAAIKTDIERDDAILKIAAIKTDIERDDAILKIAAIKTDIERDDAILKIAAIKTDLEGGLESKIEELEAFNSEMNNLEVRFKLGLIPIEAYLKHKGVLNGDIAPPPGGLKSLINKVADGIEFGLDKMGDGIIFPIEKIVNLCNAIPNTANRKAKKRHYS